LRREGVLPEMSNDYFASLTFMDLSLGPMQGICKSMGARELAVYRTAGMAIANAAAYATHPARVVRTVRNLIGGIYATSGERRLGTTLRRGIGVRPSPGF